MNGRNVLVLLMVGAAVAAPGFGRGAALGQPEQNEAAPAWRWKSANPLYKSLHLRFVRGEVRIIRRPGPLQVEIIRRALSGYPTDAELLTTEDGSSIIISDRYPSRAAWLRRESLPPMDERGDFWHSIVWLDVTVLVPGSTYVQAELMDGQIDGADRCVINSDPRCAERMGLSNQR